MADHSTIVGGSTAGRLIECPGSFAAIRALPPSADTPSEYAEEGTAMHAVMAQLMERRQRDPGLPMRTCVAGWVGETFYDRKLTEDHLATMIYPAIQALVDLERDYGSNFVVIGVERRVTFPGVPGAFGTVDAILRDATCVLHVDWKFGAGVPVSATYQTPEGELVNPQLLFYVTAAHASLRNSGVYTGKPKLVGAIIQPRSDNPLSHTEIQPIELKYFRADVERAVLLALQADPPRVKGAHCRFAPCKIACPLWTGPLLDLTAIATPTTGDGVLTPVPVAADHSMAKAYGEFLAHAKVLVDMAAMYKNDIDTQMHAFLEAGGHIPGWRLKAKVKQRVWVDEKELVPRLRKIGFKMAEIYQKKLLTFAAADARARQLGVDPKLLDEWRMTPPTRETTIATVDDPAPVVNRIATTDKFRASLKLLTESK